MNNVHDIIRVISRRPARESHQCAASPNSQQRGRVKDKVYKRPVSVPVVIFAQDTKRVLMLQRRDDPDFWQSVTGSIEEGDRVAGRRT